MTIRLVKDRDYYVEIWNDADEHYIRIEALDSFDAAERLFKKLTEGEPDMRVVMHREIKKNLATASLRQLV